MEGKHLLRPLLQSHLQSHKVWLKESGSCIALLFCETQGDMLKAVGRRLMTEAKKAWIGGDTMMARTLGKVFGPDPWPLVSQKFAFLRTVSTRYECLEWYMIGVSNKTEEQKKMMFGKSSCGGGGGGQYIYPSLFGGFGTMSFSATLGSTFCCLGGTIRNDFGITTKYSRDVFMLDFTRPDEGFKKVSPMVSGRALAVSVALAGKLYVFGGTMTDEEPFGECFDPKEGKWKTICQPPISLPHFTSIFAISYDDGDDGEKTNTNILVGPRCGKALLYNVESESWSYYINNPICLEYCDENPVKVGNTLYWLRGRIYAYDLNSHKSYSGDVKGSVLHEMGDDAVTYRYPTHLLHLAGNVFCFFSNECPTPDSNEPSIFLCTKFQVNKQANGYLDATTISTQSYLVDHPVHFVDGMPLDEMFAGSVLSSREKAMV